VIRTPTNGSAVSLSYDFAASHDQYTAMPLVGVLVM